jgi:methyl-accepting chemotaxis protein
MMQPADISQTVPKSYLNKFVVRSTLIFAVGALLAVAVFAIVPQDRALTYADSFKIIAGMNRDLVTKSLKLFSFTLFLIIIGIVVISVAYSHRVAGPLHKLGMQCRKMASGDLSGSVRLRNNDVLHALSDDLNMLSLHYRDHLLELQKKCRELSLSIDRAEGLDSRCDGSAPLGEISEKIDEIRDLINTIKL